MKGLLEQPGMKAGGAQVPQTERAPLTAGGQATPPGNASAGELNQQDLDMMVANGMKLIHNEKVSDVIIKRVADARNPIPAIADATISIVTRLEQSAKKAGKQLSLTTLAYGANYIMGEIIASAEAAGMKKMSDSEKYRAFSLTIGKYLDDAMKTGKMTKEQVLQMGKEAEGTDLGQKMAGMEMGGEQEMENPPTPAMAAVNPAMGV